MFQYVNVFLTLLWLNAKPFLSWVARLENVAPHRFVLNILYLWFYFTMLSNSELYSVECSEYWINRNRCGRKRLYPRLRYLLDVFSEGLRKIIKSKVFCRLVFEPARTDYKSETLRLKAACLVRRKRNKYVHGFAHNLLLVIWISTVAVTRDKYILWPFTGNSCWRVWN